MPIIKVESELLKVPLKRPVSRPGGQDPRAANQVEVLVVRLLTDAQHIGLGFTYAFDGGALLQSILVDHIVPLVLNEDPVRGEWIFLKAAQQLAALGWPSLAARAYAAVDFALWDLKGKLANLPVHSLLGGYRTKLKSIVTDTATPALGVKQSVKETRAQLDRGAAGVQIEVGTQDPDVDVDRLRQILEGLPEGPWLEVSAAGRYDASSALWMGRAFEEEFGIDAYLDPLPVNDESGWKRLSDRLELSLGGGAECDRVEDCLRLMECGIGTLRLDPVKLGGLTPARKLAHTAELKRIAIAPVRLPEIGAQLAAGVVYGRCCEYVDWFDELFTGGPRFENCQLVVPDAPGLGLSVNESFASKHRM